MDPNTGDKCPYERHTEERHTEKREGASSKKQKLGQRGHKLSYAGGLQKLEKQDFFPRG